MSGCTPSLDSARHLRLEGRFEDELKLLDQALIETPDQPELLEAAGDVRLRLAVRPFAIRIQQ